eukprot:m.221800 g.221800  ORF g.221800 m.221800 type:complete len:259 (-) comp18726_c0_seq3:105-881(-)
MAAQGHCCPPGSWPSLKVDYTPQGKEETIGDMACYVASPDAPTEKAVIVIPDIFGVNSGRIKAICDQLATEGFLVVEPDFFRGEPFPEGGDVPKDLPAWCKRFPADKVFGDVNDHVVPYLEGKGIKSIGLWGFCWGSWAIFHICANPAVPASIKGGVNCHPSLKLEAWVWESSPVELADKVTKPQLLNSASNDPDFVLEGGDVINKLKAKPFGADCDVKNFGDMQHGWVNRGDISQEAVARDVRLAIERGVAFLQKVV